MYKFSFLEKAVGAVFAVAVVLLFVLILFLGRANEWFRPCVRYYTVLMNASDVSPGKKIYYKGIVVGKVSKVTIQKDDSFRVDFQVYIEYTNRIRSDSLFMVRSELLGGKRFEIVPGGEHSEVLGEGSMVYSLDTYEGKILAKLRGYYSPEEDISRIINNVSLITSLILDQLSEGGEIEKTIRNINTILTNVNTSVTKLNTSTLPSATFVIEKRVPELIDDLTEVLASLQSVIKNENIVKSLKNVDKITSDISEITDDLKRNRNNLGSIITNLEKLSKNVSELVVSLKRIID